VRPINISSSRVLSFVRGFSLHAATRIDADDRAGLERLARYVARPPWPPDVCRSSMTNTSPFASPPWSGSTSFLVLSPLELIEKLGVLVPTPEVGHHALEIG